jgi:phosphate transport system permease protein
MATNTSELSPADLRLRDEATFRAGLSTRHLRGRIWRFFFSFALVLAFLALVALFFNVANSAFGYVTVEYAISPLTLAPEGDLEALSTQELAQILVENQNNRIPVYLRDYLFTGDVAQFTALPMAEALPNAAIPESARNKTVRDLDDAERLAILADNLNASTLASIVRDQVVVERVVEAYPLVVSLFEADRIRAATEEGQRTYFRSWINADFINAPASSNAIAAGIRPAVFGSIWVVVVTILVALPLGVGAAIYLEEYADPRQPVNRLIEINIRNLAGVPSIIYGLLGLAVFVRALESFTGGRTILAASLTMSLLILPVIIINAQEAIRAVPYSIREASYGLGATKWQTIYRQVMPAAIPGVLTGTILAMSRAIGETAPLIVIGASTFILFAPNGLQSKFTVLPLQIYQWTSRPQPRLRS